MDRHSDVRCLVMLSTLPVGGEFQAFMQDGEEQIQAVWGEECTSIGEVIPFDSTDPFTSEPEDGWGQYLSSGPEITVEFVIPDDPHCNYNIYPVGEITGAAVVITGSLWHDWDQNGVVDLADHLQLLSCMIGPDQLYFEGCWVFDVDQDQDIDLTDVANFQRAFAPGN